MKNVFSEIIDSIGILLKEKKMKGVKWMSSSIDKNENLQEKSDMRGSLKSLDTLKNKISKCHKCSISEGRTNIVFGEGNPNADIMFVGEAPGKDEDLQGKPFVGRAGKLLTDIITKGMKIKREDVFIANILKCRPPDNRNPLSEEISNCENYLLDQIKIIKPKIICTLGNFASQTLIGTKTGITKIRGQIFDYHGIKLLPTFHPAYLLRNYSKKNREYVWQDVKTLLKELEK